MKVRHLLLAALGSLALASASAAPYDLVQDSATVTSLAEVIQQWQERILAYNLPINDPKNWALRNMAKFSTLSPERAALARKATTLGELELVLNGAPIPDGTKLGLLLATKPGNISLAVTPSVNSEMSYPAASPGLYNDLVFTAVPSCRFYDSRPSQGGLGTWLAGSAHLIQIGPYTSYAFQGGSATSCGLDAFVATGGTDNSIAAIMAAVSTVNQSGAGYLTFYSSGAPDPSATVVSAWFQPGYVQTSFVVMTTDRVAPVQSTGKIMRANSDVIIDVVGYFAKKLSQRDYADFYALMPIDNAATVAVGTDVQFPQNGPASGATIARTGVSTFNLASIGTYQVMFQVSVSEAGQLILTLNGTDLASTVVGRATVTNQIVGVALVTTSVINSILTVRNPAGNPAALTITPIAGGTRAVSAHLVIERLN